MRRFWFWLKELFFGRSYFYGVDLAKPGSNDFSVAVRCYRRHDGVIVVDHESVEKEA